MEKKKAADQTPNNDKKQALDTAIRQIEKNFGKGAVMRLGDRPDLQVDAIPTGSLALDAALGIGGVPKGRIIEIYGPESSGKTTLALHIVAQAQKRGGEVAFVDAEHALDPDYAARIGVDIDSMLVSQPDTGEQALEITDALVRSGAVDVVVVDSVAALTPRAEIEGEMGDTFVGLQARLMSQALRKLAGNISKTNCVVHLHQPAAYEDRRHVRQPRNDDRRQRAEILCICPYRYPPHGGHQKRLRGHRQPHAGQDRQE